MKVLHIISYFGRPLYVNLLIALSKYCEKQTVFYPYRGSNNVDYDLYKYNISYLQKNILNFWTRLFYLYKIFVQYKSINEEIDEYSYNIIHAHSLFSDGGLAYFLNKKHKMPYIVAIRSTDTDIFFKYKPWLIYFARQILNNAEQVICISPYIYNQIRHIFKGRYLNKTIIIPNGINKSFFEKTEIKKFKEKEKIQLLYVGEFYKIKNIDKIIEYSNSRKDIELTIVGGKGDYEERIIRLIKENNNVIYKGIINNIKELKSIYYNADIFLMPSLKETFGLVYIEAMSQGTPVIYSKNRGIDGYFAEGEVGYSVDPYDFNGWDMAINSIMKDYMKYSKNAYNKAQQFSWPIFAEIYYKKYTNFGTSSKK